MAAKNGKSKDLQHFLKSQLEEAQKKFHTLEKDAEKALNELVARGKESRKDLQTLIQKINSADFSQAVLANPRVKQFSKRAEVAGHDLKKALDGLQSKVVEASGVASQQQVKELKGELNRLAKKIDALVGKKAKTETNA